jgi:hypothetical protein
VDPVPDPLLLRKSGSAGNRARDLWVSSQELLTTRPQRRTQHTYIHTHTHIYIYSFPRLSQSQYEENIIQLSVILSRRLLSYHMRTQFDRRNLNTQQLSLLCVGEQHHAMKNGVFWDVTPCGSCKKQTFRRSLAPPSSG